MGGFISGIIRRLLGGWKPKGEKIKKIILYIFLVLLYAPTIYFNDYHTYAYEYLNKYVFVALATFSLIYAETKGHFPGFMCGTEDPQYIQDELNKGRKIPFRKIVTWFGKIRGYEEFDKEWCFWQLLLCKTVWCIFPAIFIGKHFLLVGLSVAFIYPCAFWVQFKPFKTLLVSPTNWGEFVQGALYFKALL